MTPVTAIGNATVVAITTYSDERGIGQGDGNLARRTEPAQAGFLLVNLDVEG